MTKGSFLKLAWRIIYTHIYADASLRPHMVVTLGISGQNKCELRSIRPGVVFLYKRYTATNSHPSLLSVRRLARCILTVNGIYIDLDFNVTME